MEYIFVEEGTLQEIAKIERKPEDRPHPGDFITIKIFPTQEFKITRSIPSNNPANVTVTYVVEYVSDLQLIAPGGPAAFAQYYLDNIGPGGDSGTWFFQH